MTLVTVDQYYRYGFGKNRTQLVAGEIITGHRLPIHGMLHARLSAELFIWAEDGPERGLALASVGVVIGEYDAYQPDGAWISDEHRPEDLDESLARVPDLCVEIRSPSTWRYDVGTKKRVYEHGGLPELWLVDTVAECVLVYRRTKPEAPTFDVEIELTTGDELASPQLPGFALPLGRLFRP